MRLIMEECFNVPLDMNNENAILFIVTMCRYIGLRVKDADIELMPKNDDFLYYKINGINSGNVHISHIEKHKSLVWNINIYDANGQNDFFKGITCSYYATVISDVREIHESWVLSPKKNGTRKQIIFSKINDKVVKAEAKTLSYYTTNANKNVGAIIVTPSEDEDIDLIKTSPEKLTNLKYISNLLKLSYYSYTATNVYKEIFGSIEVLNTLNKYEKEIDNYLLIFESYEI